jgi:hypothetical protein
MEYAAYLREIDRAAEATDGKVVSLAGGRQSCQPVTSQKPGRSWQFCLRGPSTVVRYFRQAGVQRDEQVEALLLAHLTDHQPGGPHAQRLLDQPAQRDLARALEVGLAGLHRDHVWERDTELEDLFAGDHPLASRDRRAQAVQQPDLAGLSSADG